MYRNKSVSTHEFAMVPRADIPRAAFRMQKTHKKTFDAGGLYPVLVEEVLPGDTFSVKMTAFARLSTPIFPIMDNMYLDSFFFFVPNRLVWTNWKRFMGEQDSPGASISYVIPKCTSLTSGFQVNGIADHMGLPTVGQVTPGLQLTVSALPFRAYNLIYNEWFRDENMVNAVAQNVGDGPDAPGDFGIWKRGKRHDYFTSCLPWPQKGGVSVTIPLGNTAPILSSGANISWSKSDGTSSNLSSASVSGGSAVVQSSAVGNAGAWTYGPIGSTVTGLYADLSAASAATINQLRQSFQIQKLLERDARGGTRYTEIVRSHFGVISPDARLQRPEYLGGGSAPVVLNPIAQTSGSGLTGGSTPLGNLAAIGTMVANNHGFRQSFTEHGYIIGLINVRADLSYQQGIRRHWSRSTRYDFYFPAFSHLGEQAVLMKEIYADGSGTDNAVFGYQERWAEYRYSPSEICGLFRSTAAGTLDAWHLAQRFTSAPILNTTFIQENPPLSRVLAVGAAANGAQFIFDSFFDMHVVRPMPLYSVPGLIDHF